MKIVFSFSRSFLFSCSHRFAARVFGAFHTYARDYEHCRENRKLKDYASVFSLCPIFSLFLFYLTCSLFCIIQGKQRVAAFKQSKFKEQYHFILLLYVFFKREDSTLHSAHSAKLHQFPQNFHSLFWIFSLELFFLPRRRLVSTRTQVNQSNVKSKLLHGGKFL